ncbi:MAG: preprotein translocase subunit SecD [Candidatus Berkelbacteria bacterium Licking1014_7]|uniref:Protein translocase subunit SecD n=1 Tax=Candidatus Berkelbacteria bacterium Licking1014_7 TaxID=2017147 RepID=A0A554LK29_9BACT|nr:MAG: preprotein translocase subunit SecD [Candidatus Berkelbacteria bacterium Licking1014_7]
MKKNIITKLCLILIILALAILIDMPSGPNLKFWFIDKKLDIVQGLDLAGGVHIEYEADFSKIETANQKQALAGAINVIEKRVNGLGVSEPTIRETSYGDKKGISVELAGIKNPKEALDTIGKTAELTFEEQVIDPSQGGGDGSAPGWNLTGLTGAHLAKADVTFSGANSQSINNKPQISLKFNAEGARRFGEITARNIGKPVAIVLDGALVSAPTVQNEISAGDAVITGEFTLKGARELALQLNSGALPVPLKVVSERSIGATLGNESIQKSLIAGIIGLLVVFVYMVFYYRLSGLIAGIALIIYTLIVLAIFKLIPITLTLSGIAGFILSIGAAVDANILIFERTKEELKQGNSLQEAIETGFDRAWLSIRDSNMASIITAIILIWLSTGLVRGFAITLLIGILVSMFSAITISKTLMLLILKEKLKK